MTAAGSPIGEITYIMSVKTMLKCLFAVSVETCVNRQEIKTRLC